MLVSPDVLTRTAKSEEWILFPRSPRRFQTPIFVPTEQSRVTIRQIFFFGRGLGAFALRVIVIARPEQTAASRGGLYQHSGTTWVRWPIGHAMLDNMNIDAWTKAACSFSPQLPCALHNFLDGEIESLRILAVQYGCSNPYFVRDLDLSLQICGCHTAKDLHGRNSKD